MSGGLGISPLRLGSLSCGSWVLSMKSGQESVGATTFTQQTAIDLFAVLSLDGNVAVWSIISTLAT